MEYLLQITHVRYGFKLLYSNIRGVLTLNNKYALVSSDAIFIRKIRSLLNFNLIIFPVKKPISLYLKTLISIRSLAPLRFVDFRKVDNTIHLLKKYKIDSLVVYSMPYLIPSSVLANLQGNNLNVHTALLPDYRGPDPVTHAIIDGRKLGLTIHLIDDGEDTGAICFQKEYPIRGLFSYKSELFDTWVINTATNEILRIIKNKKNTQFSIENGTSRTQRAKRLDDDYLVSLIMQNRIDLFTIQKLILMRINLINRILDLKGLAFPYSKLRLTMLESPSTIKLSLPQ